MCIHIALSMVILSPMEQATLEALAYTCNYSLHAHVPAEAVMSRFRKHLRGEVRKMLKKLRAKGLCFEHPTGRNTTYQLTLMGLNAVKSNPALSP